MSVNFSFDRWEKVKETYDLWWDKKLSRPIVPVVLNGENPNPPPNAPLLSQATCADFSYSAEELIDRIDYELSYKIYMGDAFPFVNLDSFGPGVIAAFLGAEPDNSTGRVWFGAPKNVSANDLHFEFDRKNIWLNRIKDICAAAMKKWKGLVMVGMPDLGGAMDILQIFRHSEQLFLELYDEPDELKRLLKEITELWIRYYQEIDEVLQPVNPGYCDWSGIYKPEPGYIFQADASYMISVEHFNEFVKPELEFLCRKLKKNFYHLDGVGQIRHLDSLLTVENLHGIQWIPGAGAPDVTEWPEIYQKISNAGKLIQVAPGSCNIDSFQVLDTVIKQIGSAKNIQIMTINLPPEQGKEAEKKLGALTS